jgi:Predicted hydrolases or acyltransferases (alpha/beta hydrolase superfamily)
VLCPDVPGRGESDWLPSVADYGIPVYVRAMQQMLVQEGIVRCHWIGTSMGGLIGMALAALPDTPLSSFVINDVGPEIERAALERIAGYMRGRASFASYPELFAAAFPAILPFGPLTDEQRHHLIRTSCERRADGRWHFRTDPKIGEAFLAALAQPPADLWPLWQAWSARARPTLILRGEHSDLFSPDCMQRMLSMHPQSKAITIADTGHAPMLMDQPTIETIAQFLADAYTE